MTLGGDRGYDTKGFVAELRKLKVTPHVARNDSNRRSAIDERTTRHEGYAVSQRKRKRVDEVFGWPPLAVGFQSSPSLSLVSRVQGWFCRPQDCSVLLAAFGVVLTARALGKESVLGASFASTIGSLMLSNGVYVALHWAHRPQNLFGPNVPPSLITPLGIVLVPILRLTGTIKPPSGNGQRRRA